MYPPAPEVSSPSHQHERKVELKLKLASSKYRCTVVSLSAHAFQNPMIIRHSSSRFPSSACRQRSSKSCRARIRPVSQQGAYYEFKREAARGNASASASFRNKPETKSRPVRVLPIAAASRVSSDELLVSGLDHP